MDAQEISTNSGNKIIKPENKIIKPGKKNMKTRASALVKRFRFVIVFAFVIMVLYCVNMPAGIKAFKISASNTQEMLGLIPPIFIFMGLLDAWIPKETFIRYMGENSGIKGIFTALFLGSAAAGPLYIAFPIAVLLMKKKQSLHTYCFSLEYGPQLKFPFYSTKFHTWE